MSNLCTLAGVKARLKIDTFDVTDDVLLAGFIAWCGERFDQFCNRRFERSAAATHEFPADVMDVMPDRYPIESVASWHLKASEADGWEAQTGVEYLIRRSSIITLVDGPLGSEHELGRVTYAGGYVLPGATAGAGQTALPSDIERVAIEQVAFWYQRRNQLGLQSLSTEGGSISQFQRAEMLVQVEEAMRQHIRMSPTY